MGELLATKGVTYSMTPPNVLLLTLLDENRLELNRMTRTSLKGQLLPYGNHIVVYYKQYFAFFNVPEYSTIIMDIVEPAKSKLRKNFANYNKNFYID